MALENDKKMSNIKALRQFMLAGKKVYAGDVVAKSDFPTSGDYMNLCAMTPPRAEQTNAKVGKAKSGDKSPALPGT